MWHFSLLGSLCGDNAGPKGLISVPSDDANWWTASTESNQISSEQEKLCKELYYASFILRSYVPRQQKQNSEKADGFSRRLFSDSSGEFSGLPNTAISRSHTTEISLWHMIFSLIFLQNYDLSGRRKARKAKSENHQHHIIQNTQKYLLSSDSRQPWTLLIVRAANTTPCSIWRF